MRWLLVASFRVFEFAARDAGVAAREASSWGILVSFRVFCPSKYRLIGSAIPLCR